MNKKMKVKNYSFLCVETAIVICILIAFSLNWIHVGKVLSESGWGVPHLYEKSTNVANTMMFFAKKDSPHTGKFLYLIPTLAIITAIFILIGKTYLYRLCLLITSIAGLFFSVYMYYYFISSKLFSLSNCGVGIHLLFAVSLVGILYSIYLNRRRKRRSAQLSDSLIADLNV